MWRTLGGLRRGWRSGKGIQLGLQQGQLAAIGKNQGDVITVVFEIQQNTGRKAEQPLSEGTFIHNSPFALER
jgi:hypothetical protein